MTTPRINKYINNLLKEGVPPQRIQENLSEAGWDPLETEQAITAASKPIKESPQSSTPIKFLKGFLIAALLTVPLLGLPLLAETGIYPEFWLQLIVVAIVGGLVDIIYLSTIQKLLTPVSHSARARLRWLLAGPPLVALLIWLAHIPLLFSVFAVVIAGLIANLILRKSLIWDSIVSSIWFGGLYVILYLVLSIPVIRSTDFLSWQVEGIVSVFFFGALWGPLYTAFKSIPRPNPVASLSPHRHIEKKLFVAIFLVILVAGSYWTYDRFVRAPSVLAVSPIEGTLASSLTSPITVTFNRPINRAKLSVAISPPIPGDISFGNQYLQQSFVRQVIFTPSSHLQPGTSYSMKVTQLGNVLGRKEANYSLTFQTPSLPSIASVSIQNVQKDVNICDPITVKLDQSPNHMAEFSFQLTPATLYTTTESDDNKTYTITPSNCLNQGVAYSLSIKRLLTVYGKDQALVNSTDQPVALKTVSFTTKAPPGIKEFSPQGTDVLGNIKQLNISFSEPMVATDPSTLLSIQPPLQGSWSWKDSQTLQYAISVKLQLDTKYTVSISRGLKDVHNGFFAEDSSFTFTTVGHVRATISPRPGSGGVSVGTAIRITFDQPVDRSSAEAKFSITPTSAGRFSWQGQTMVYSATLHKDSSYHISVAAGVKSLIGLPLESTVGGSFQTEESVFKLNIPLHYQQYPQSCEVASLKMALNYRGIDVDEPTLLANLKVDSAPRQDNVWGDPYQGFVGDVHGHQNTTGYGVYAGPIASLANKYRSAQELSGISITDISSNLTKGNPIVLWGTGGNAKPDSWVTPAGRQVSGWLGEHARLVIGFTGPVNSPTGFIVNDPIYGRLYWTSSYLQGNMSAFNGMGVVIF